MSRSPLTKLLTHGALLTSLLVIALLVHQHRELSQQYREQRARSLVLQAGDAVPAFRARTTLGDSITIGESQPGTRQLLFLLTKECPYCRATLPFWKQIAAAVRNSPKMPVTAVAVALDSLPKMTAYLESFGVNVPIVEFPSPRLKRIYRAVAVPQTIILSDSGSILYSRTGVITDARVRDSVIFAALRPPRRVASAVK
jgi:thiol-disulfide isomerase/thioredoxin